MRLASVEECRAIDRRSQEEYGIAGETLMETAGRLSAEFILKHLLKRAKTNLRTRVAVVCGTGGNGGDGLVVARYLEQAGVDVDVFLLDRKSPHALFQTNLQKIESKKIRLLSIESDLNFEFEEASLIVDALFGIGLSRPPAGLALSVIKAINSSSVSCVSLDVPSGLDADRGLPLGEAVLANVTLTFGIAKRGFAVNEGPKTTGQLEVLDIGFPKELVCEVASTTLGFDRRLAKKYLPLRASSSNKTTHGRAAIFAGSSGMGGAAVLGGSAASRVGAGYVLVATDGNPQDILCVMPEFLTADFRDEKIFKSARWTAAAVGPGLGDAANKCLVQLRESSSKPLVVDADALTALAHNKHSLPLPANWILTPHAGELSRLIGVGAKEIEADRFEFAGQASRKFGAIVVLKGFRTVVSNGEKTVVILSGNSALAKAGSGDVLTGFITGFLAQGLSPFTAACLAAYVHGRLADEWVRLGMDRLSLQPSDLIRELPLLLSAIRKGV